MWYVKRFFHYRKENKLARNKPCRRPGCRALTKHKSGFCEKHYRPITKRYDKEVRDPDAKRFYNSKGWQAIRKAHLAANPLCYQCLNGEHEVITAANTVHHKDGDRSNNDTSNLESICPACHNRVDGHRWNDKKDDDE